MAKFEKCKALKKYISEELMPVACHPNRWWDYCMSKHENKEIDPIFIEELLKVIVLIKNVLSKNISILRPQYVPRVKIFQNLPFVYYCNLQIWMWRRNLLAHCNILYYMCQNNKGMGKSFLKTWKNWRVVLK